MSFSLRSARSRLSESLPDVVLPASYLVSGWAVGSASVPVATASLALRLLKEERMPIVVVVRLRLNLVAGWFAGIDYRLLHRRCCVLQLWEDGGMMAEMSWSKSKAKSMSRSKSKSQSTSRSKSQSRSSRCSSCLAQSEGSRDMGVIQLYTSVQEHTFEGAKLATVSTPPLVHMHASLHPSIIHPSTN